MNYNILKIFICIFILTFPCFAKEKKSIKNNEIKIALIFRYDDRFNPTLSFLDQGLQLAKEEFEKSQRIKVLFFKYAHNETVQSVIRATKKAIKDGHNIIIGGEDSAESLAIGKTIEGKNIILITPTSTNPTVTYNKPFVFRACFSDDIVANKMAELVFNKFRSKRIGILHNVSYPYTDYLAKKFINRISELNDTRNSLNQKRTKIFVKKIIRNQKKFTKEVEFFKANNIEHQIMLTFQSDLLRFYSEALKQNFYPIYFGSDGWGSNDSIFNRMAKEGLQRSKFQAYRNLYWRSEVNSTKNRKFKKIFKKRFKVEANAWSAIAYDTAKIVLESIIAAKDMNNISSIRKALRNYSSKKLITTDNFSFGENNTPKKDMFIYKIDSSGVRFYEKAN